MLLEVVVHQGTAKRIVVHITVQQAAQLILCQDLQRKGVMHTATPRDTHPVTVLAMLMEKTIQGLAVPVVIVRITVRGMRLEQEAQPPVITPQRPC
ncbi:MAG TPA: hypothetical protein VEP90_23835 [Methylomirabilota bacterium]|nr:hypothetical protein [Methylomirabilota bacterium]